MAWKRSPPYAVSLLPHVGQPPREPLKSQSLWYAARSALHSKVISTSDMHGPTKALQVCVVPHCMWSPLVQPWSGKSVRMWHMSQVTVEVEVALVVLTEVLLTVDVSVLVRTLEQ